MGKCVIDWHKMSEKTFFIADISANHDGDFARAKTLIRLAAESGADAAKFQNFRAKQIVSERGFAALGTNASHQSSWKKSVVEVYRDAEVPWGWTGELAAECARCGIAYLSTPYDLEAVDMLNEHVPAFKIGSGDITWPEMLLRVAEKKKPVILATGASTIGDVQRAVATLQAAEVPFALMQCNTNYTASLNNFRHIHLNVLKAYRLMFSDALLGLSDHTPGHATVLGAVALGARIVEKHFTDDTSRVGPDHPFSMTPSTWRDMVDRTRELELALGSSNKVVAENERETVVVQRRCLRAAENLAAGVVLDRSMIDVLRPAPPNAIEPHHLPDVVGKRLTRSLRAGDAIEWSMLDATA